MSNRVVPLPRSGGGQRPHAIYLAIGFPPAAKSSAYRLRETANQFVAMGWDITVITICQEAWEREYGLDHTLSEKVDPRVKVVELPLIRQDLETDIRAFSEERTLDPAGWIKRLRQREQRAFPSRSSAAGATTWSGRCCGCTASTRPTCCSPPAPRT